ncbi:DUF6573 family protein [Pseudodesulfovibrio methanolicus]|uniref:DUF6573 family protein n=1 Tax=Pseudodesulfovibrio methanolicus TaxID=3126690 RepID=A0ABZ2IYE7_9BACT
MSFEGLELIYSYSRKQAIEDGVLIDVTDQANETGFKVPVAISDHLYNGYIVPPDGLDGEGQSISGRLRDVLLMTFYAAKVRWDGERVYFEVLFLMGEGPRFEKVQCVAIVGPGDEGEPVMTICLPEDE